MRKAPLLALAAAWLAVSLSNSASLAGEREMLAALAVGDVDAMRTELEAGADPDGAHGTPLPMATWLPVYRAAEAGRADALALLVEFGADIDMRDRNGDRPLDWASRYGELEVVRLLVGAGSTPDPREAGNDVNVPLAEAADGGHVDVAHFLLDAGADPDRANRFDATALYQAAKLKDTALAARLIAMGADVAFRRDMTFETPLHNAAARSTPEMVRLLIEAGAPLDARDWDGETPLFQAALLGRHEIVAILVEAGAAVDIPDERGRSPLVAALSNRPKPDYARQELDDPFVSTRSLILAQKGWPRDRDVDALARLLAPRTQDLDTALAEAVWGGWEEAARILVARGALVHGRTLDGRATLAGSFFYPGLSMFELLFAANKDLGIAGNEAFVAAAAAGRMDIPRAILSGRYSVGHYLVDTRDDRGWTGLLAAAVEGRVETVAQLHGLGADPSLRDKAGNGVVELMRKRLANLICLAESREASRAWLPTDYIRGEAARLLAAYGEILRRLGMADAAGAIALPEKIAGCGFN